MEGDYCTVLMGTRGQPECGGLLRLGIIQDLDQALIFQRLESSLSREGSCVLTIMITKDLLACASPMAVITDH